jgi:hypothetical protein
MFHDKKHRVGYPEHNHILKSLISGCEEKLLVFHCNLN